MLKHPPRNKQTGNALPLANSHSTKQNLTISPDSKPKHNHLHFGIPKWPKRALRLDCIVHWFQAADLCNLPGSIKSEPGVRETRNGHPCAVVRREIERDYHWCS
jgi:hypothetical protein